MSLDSDLSNKFFDSDVVNDDFFAEIVEKQLNLPRDKFKIRLILLTSATGKSENFVSEVYRVKIKIKCCENEKSKVIDVIMKASFSTLKELKTMGVFLREQLMYENVIPSFEAIWKEKANVEIKFGPQCFKVESEPYEIIMLEDLKTQGYEMRDKRYGLSLLETKLALSKLAKFHAASAIRYEKDKFINPCLDKSTQLVERPPDSPVHKAFNLLHQKFLSCVKSLNVSDAIVDKISKWNMEKMLKSFSVPITPLKCGFRILNHGDTWLNNIMFKKDEEGNYFDALFVDFQLSYWGTPNADLIYLLFSSVDDDVKVTHFDEILDHFYNELIKSLKELKYEAHIPSIEELREDFVNLKLFANGLFLTVIPIARNTSGKEFELTQFFSGSPNDEQVTSMFFNETFKKITETWLPFMNERGLLDINDE